MWGGCQTNNAAQRRNKSFLHRETEQTLSGGLSSCCRPLPAKTAEDGRCWRWRGRRRGAATEMNPLFLILLFFTLNHYTVYTRNTKTCTQPQTHKPNKQSSSRKSCVSYTGQCKSKRARETVPRVTTTNKYCDRLSAVSTYFMWFMLLEPQAGLGKQHGQRKHSFQCFSSCFCQQHILLSAL